MGININDLLFFDYNVAVLREGEIHNSGIRFSAFFKEQQKNLLIKKNQCKPLSCRKSANCKMHVNHCKLNVNL